MTRLAFGLAVLLAATHASALSESEFVQKGERAVAIARTAGLQAAEKIYANPKNGFLALDGPGLCVWAADANGVILFDFAGQTMPGTDISLWTNEDGANLMDAISGAIALPKGGFLRRFKGIPHPKTNRLGEADFYCGRVAAGAIVCATYWPDAH